MKKYKVFSSLYPADVEKVINKLVKKGYEFYDWKINNNCICVIMTKEETNE